MNTPPNRIVTDNTACRICMNCRFYTAALRTRKGKPVCTLRRAALGVQPYAAACKNFQQPEH